MRIVVLGTGTSIGKTELAVALVRGARALGFDTIGLKPIATGLDRPDDADRLGSASGTRVAPRYAFTPPISPHLAAREDGVTIQLTEVADWVVSHSREVTVVESAGGALSPVSDTTTNLDLLLALQPAGAVLVTYARLGVFHDVAAAILATRWQAPEVRWSAVVVSGASAAEAAACSAELNRAILPRVGCDPVAVAFGPADQLDEDGAAALFRSCSGSISSPPSGS